jgi:hypothetical protein
VEVLKGIADIMYIRDGSKGANAVALMEQKFEDLKLQFPMAREFMDYFEKQWGGGYENVGYRFQEHLPNRAGY